MEPAQRMTVLEHFDHMKRHGLKCMDVDGMHLLLSMY